jgi:hypothetical protein
MVSLLPDLGLCEFTEEKIAMSIISWVSGGRKIGIVSSN